MGLYIEKTVGYAILNDREILSLSGFSFNFEVNFQYISGGPQALNYFKQHVSSSSPQPLGTPGFKKCAVCRLEFSYNRFWQIFIRDVLVVFLSRGSLRSFVLLFSESVMQGM